MPIRIYISDEHAAFEPEQISAMSQALESACATLEVTSSDERDRRVIAERIIDLARNGVVDAAALCKRVVQEAQALRSL